MTYLPKDQVVARACATQKPTFTTVDGRVSTRQRLVIRETVDAPVGSLLPSTLVDHFIDQASYRWIMNFCICRQGDHCQEFPHDLGCIFLGEAVLNINPKFGRLVSKEEAQAHARKAREMGLVHLIGRDRLDSVWLGARPFGKLMTICQCCPCCCLFRILPDLNPAISQRISRLPGVSVWVEPGACTGCGQCVRSDCFVEAIRIENGQAHIGAGCRGCGRCVEICPQHAIHLTIEDSAYLDKALNRISSLVDISSAEAP